MCIVEQYPDIGMWTSRVETGEVYEYIFVAVDWEKEFQQSTQ